MQSDKGWKWYGFPGHHICGARCVFHLCTNIGGIFLVSTIGHFAPDPLGNPKRIEEISAGAKYETMVFPISGETQSGDSNKISYNALRHDKYNDSLVAETGHYQICWEYADKARKYHDMRIDEKGFLEFCNELKSKIESCELASHEYDRYEAELQKLYARDFSREEYALMKTTGIQYTREYFETIPSYGDVFTMEEWLEQLDSGGIIDDDGCGHYAKDGMMAGDSDPFSDEPEDATHVVWFNN